MKSADRPVDGRAQTDPAAATEGVAAGDDAAVASVAGTAASAAVAAAGAAASLSADVLAGVRFLRSFDGLAAGPEILASIGAGRASGVTQFRGRNVSTPAQVRSLCRQLQNARPAGDPPLVIGFDQEGGQLQAVGDGATAWPGNLALGASRSEDLARRSGRAIADEVAAMGGTLVYGPVCDVLHRSSATPMGTRPFGDDPALVARLAAAMTAGIQEAGVAATLKHFPGHGAAASDSHLGLPVIDHDLAQLRDEDLPPFRAGIAAGALAVLPGHLAVPALTNGVPIPATFAPEILEGLLRRDLGFAGVTVSDALDMAGASYANGLGGTVGAAAAAGMDLLLLNHPEATEAAAFESLRAAIAAGRLDRAGLEAARARIVALRAHFEGIVQPPIEVVGCVEHMLLAREIADASVTLVRDPGGVLPLRPGSDRRVAVIAPVPVDLTPAETSSYLRIGLGHELRARGLEVDEFEMPLDPTQAEVAALATNVSGHAAVIVCTFDAVCFPGQAALVRRIAAEAGSTPGLPEGPGAAGTEQAIVAVAMRSPYDASLFPADIAVACTYGIQPPLIEALADAMLGRIPFAGRLPVRLENPE
jgi:beta-N-acetylhexosaminidase